MAVNRAFLHRDQDPPDVSELVRIYRQAQRELQERAQQRLVKDARKLTSEAQRARLLMREVEEILRELDDQADEWIARNMPRQYFRGVRDATSGLKEIGFNFDLVPQPGVHREAVQALVDQMQTDLEIASQRILSGVQRTIKATQLEGTIDKAISKEVALGTIEGQARREVSQSIRRLLVEEFGDGPIIINGRRYGLDGYSELVARTRMAEAHTMGVQMRNIEAENDLVQVSDHGADDGCAFYEGQIFSISGTSDKYPGLAEIGGGPPFHPNCRHRLLPFVEALATEKEIERGSHVSDKVLNKPFRDVERMARKAA